MTNVRADKKTASLPPAIVIGVDTPIGLTVIRELGQRGVPVIAVGSSAHSIGGASRFTHAFFRRPKNDPISAWLPALIQQHDAAAVLAVSENDLLELAALPARIGTGQILTPRQPQLDVVLDKSRTMAAAKQLGLDTPESWQPAGGDNFAEIADDLSYPLAIKWSDPQAVISLLSAHDIPFEKIEYAQNAQELLSILRRYDAIQLWPLVQSYCPGVGLGQMLLMRGGRAALTFQHRRLHEWPVTGGVSTLCTNEAPELHREQMVKSEQLLQQIGWDGPAMVEYRFDAQTGRYWLMEINGRFWGSIPLAHYSGAHFAWEAYAGNILGIETVNSVSDYLPVKACYLIPETRRLAAILQHGLVGQRNFGRVRTLAGYVIDRLNPLMRYYVFSWRDPMPFFTDMIGVIARLRHRRS